MQRQSVETTVKINAPASQVWRMFTDPNFTKQMGGEYVSDWKVGSFLSWKGMGGNIMTKGKILKIEPEKLLEHNLFMSPDSDEVIAVLTYELHENNDNTTVQIKEVFSKPINEQEYSDSIEGWTVALQSAKELAEK